MAGSVSCTFLGLPFDVAKSRMQFGEARYTGLGDCMLRTARAEGPLALYNGWLPALGSATVENAVGITVQRSLRRQLVAAQNLEADARFSFPVEIGLGGVTGIFTSIAICPMEVLKVRLQVARDPGGWLAEARNVVSAHGVGGLFNGLGALMARDVPFNALFYGCYETICTAMMSFRGLDSKDDLGTPSIFFAGGAAGAAGWSMIIPFDVAKTRLQSGAAKGPLVGLMLKIARDEGPAALMNGWTAAVARAFPANAGLFAGVELMSRLLADV